MSSYKSANRSGEINRTNNKQAQQQQVPQKKMNRKDMDSACYRLSRVPQKYSMTKAVKSENSDSYAVTYYQSNPVDTRTMQEKLEEIESKINDSDMEEDEKFTLLVQRKALNTMIYGENSPESIRAATDFGSFYNSLEKPESALRNLSKAYAASKQVELSEEDAFVLAVELADASLNAKQPSKEKHKQIVVADNAITPFAEREEGTAQILFRKDLCLARIRAYRQKFEEAISYYEKTLSEYASFKEAEKQDDTENKENKENAENTENTEGQESPEPQEPQENQENEEKQEKQEKQNPEEEDEKDRDIVEPNLYVEAASIAERAENYEKANEWYKTAYNMYIDRGYKKAAARIEDKIPREGEFGEEEEEEEARIENEEEDMNENAEEAIYEQPEEEKQEDENKPENEEAAPPADPPADPPAAQPAAE